MPSGCHWRRTASASMPIPIRSSERNKSSASSRAIINWKPSLYFQDIIAPRAAPGATVEIWLKTTRSAPTWFTIHVTAPPLIIAFAVGFASAIVASVASSWRSARVRPTEALRDAAVNRRIMSVPRWLFGVGLLALGVYVGIRTVNNNPSDALTVKNDLPAFVPIIAGFALLAPVILKPVTP